MSKRTKIKIHRASMFLKRYIFNSKFIIRNMLAITILTTLVATIAVAVTIVKPNNSKDEVQLARSVDRSSVLTAYEVSSLDDNSINVILDEITQAEANKVVNETIMVANTEQNVVVNKFITNVDMLNIRAMSDETSDIVGILYKGYSGEIINEAGDWTEITSGDITGFVKSEYIIKSSDNSVDANQYTKKTATVIGNDINIRDAASTEANAIAIANAGEVYDVVNVLNDDEWVEITFGDNQSGFISGEFVTITTNYDEAISYEEYINIQNAKEESEEVDDNNQNVEDNNTADNSVEDTEDNQVEDSNQNDEVEQPQEDNKEEVTPPQENLNQVEVPTTSRGTVTLTEEDLYYLACIVSIESGYESYEGQLAVANVCINRLENGSWGSTMKEVIYAPYQFSAVNSSTMDNYIKNGPLPTSLEAAKEAASGVNNIGSYLSFRALYAADYASYKAYTIIGGHCFF